MGELLKKILLVDLFQALWVTFRNQKVSRDCEPGSGAGIADEVEDLGMRRRESGTLSSREFNRSC